MNDAKWLDTEHNLSILLIKYNYGQIPYWNPEISIVLKQLYQDIEPRWEVSNCVQTLSNFKTLKEAKLSVEREWGLKLT